MNDQERDEINTSSDPIIESEWSDPIIETEWSDPVAEKKSSGSTASRPGSPEPSATPQLPSGGIKVPPSALPWLGGLSVPYRAPAAEQAASPAQDQPASESVKPTAQAPAAQRNPLADFEELSSKRMNIQAAESVMTSGGDKFERMISQSASEKMSPSVKAEKERLDKSFSSIMPEVDKQVDEFLKYLNPQSYVMKDVSGLPTVDSEKLSYVAKAKADQLGLPEGGHAWKLLWNAAKDHVAYEIKRPLIEKEAKEIYKKTYGADMAADAEKMAKGFGIEAYKARAESSLDNFAKRQMEEQRQLAEREVAAFTNGMPTDKYVESINASRDAAIQELDATFSMNMTPEGFSGSQQEFDAYKSRFDAINKTAEQAFAAILEVETKAMAGANRRYNRAVEEEADRIQRGFERFASQKQPEMEKAIADRARDAYKKASEKVGAESEKAKREYDRFFASEFAYPFASMFGSWVKSMGSAAGSRDLQEWGDFVSTKYNIGSTEIEEWSDWFTDARLALRSTGALAGSMVGTMIPAIAAGVATGGVGGGVVAQTLAGGATGFLAETVDLSSRMYDDTFAETGDAALAMNRAKKVFDSQLMLAPTYSIDMLPFFGKFSGGIVKRFLKGAAMEYASETLLQEYPQNAFEKAIKKDAELSEVYKFMSFEDFNKTAMNTVGVIPMGGGGQVYQAIKESEESKAADKRLNDNAKSIVAKLKLGKLSESQIQENLLNVVANHGVKQADAVVAAMMTSGSITYEQAGGLLSDIKAAEGFVQSASEQNLGNSESYVFANLRMKLRQAEKIAETEQDPLKKEFAEKNVSKIKKDLEDIFDGKDSRYATISYPNGSFQVLTYDEARKAMKKDGFADTFRNGEVKFEAFGSDAQKLTEELASVIGRPQITEAPLTEDQETALSANKKLTEITGGAIGGEAEVEAGILAEGTESNKQTQAEPAKQPEAEVVSESELNKTRVSTVVSGPIQKQPLKPIPISRDQFTSKLSDFSDVIYRETNSEGLMMLADPLMTGNTRGDEYFSNDPDLAIGQGKNKGFLIEADASKLKGFLNASKPGYDLTYRSGSAELVARYNDKENFLESILSVTVKPGASFQGRGERKRFNSMVSGWEKIENADGSVTYRKPAGKAGEAATEASPTETVERSEEVAPTEERAPSMPDQLPGTKLTKEGEYDTSDPYTYQELKGEPLIRRSKDENGISDWDGNSNLVRLRIENAGDILRELSLRGTSADRNYLYEKINNLRDYIGRLSKKDGLAYEDTLEGAESLNKELFSALRRAWFSQPVSNEAEASARKLVYEMADVNSPERLLENLDRLVENIESFVPKKEQEFRVYTLGANGEVISGTVKEESGNTTSILTDDGKLLIRANAEVYGNEAKARRAAEAEAATEAPSKTKKPAVTKNAAKEVKEVKAVNADSEGGVTMNMDGTKYSGTGIVIPVMSEDMTQKSISGKAVAEFIESSPESARSNDNVKVGVYKFKGSDKVSIDLSVMVPPEFLENALAFAAFAGQESVYDMGAGKTVMSGNDGASPRKFTNEEIADIVESLPKGIEPAVMRGGMMVAGSDALSGFKKGDVVDLAVVAGSHFDTVVKAVVGKMSETVSSVRISGVRVSDPAATFNEKTKAIELNKNNEYWKGVPSDGLTSVVAHEGIHHLIDSSPNKEAMEATLQSVKDDLIKRGVYLGIHTGFILSEKNSPQEILAYAVSNPETRSALFRYAKELNPVARELFDADIITVPKNEGPKPGNRLFNEPLPDASRIADEYFKRVFGDKRPQFKGTREFDSERAKRVAQAFDDMVHDPTNPEVMEAYAAMVAETIEQYKILVEYGYSTEINNSEPYASSADMIADLRDRKVMKIFSTESGFGDTPITDQQRAENPLLADSGFKDINGAPLLANDLFRVVHDFFGHAELGNSFGFKGEENAWNVHARMFSLTARKAMTTETRGQNSYVNFSGVNDKVNVLRARARTLRDAGRDAEAATLVDQIYEMARFADQKIGLLPEEFYTTDDQVAGVEFPQDKEVVRSKKAEVNDKIKELQKSIWGDIASTEPVSENAKIAKRLRDKKIGGVSFIDPLFGAIGISKTLYDGALELAAKQVEKGTKIGTAIANAIKYIDERMAGKKWDKGLFGRHLNDQFKMMVNGNEVEVKRDLSEETLEVVNGWYSPLEKTIKDTKADSLTAKEWLDRVRSKEGEDMWTGLRGMLEAKNPKDRVSKRELLNYLKDNRMDVVEVVKGGIKSKGMTASEAREKLNEGYEVYYMPPDNSSEFQVYEIEESESSERNYYLESDFEGSSTDPTKFSSYQLEGEKTNYKEVLVTLPKTVRNWEKEYEIAKDKIESLVSLLSDARAIEDYLKRKSYYNLSGLSSAETNTKKVAEAAIKKIEYQGDGAAVTEFEEAIKNRNNKDERPDFRSSHFDEPNILVHLRMNTRKDADGNKVLFLEEVQSDWGQKGKREGFFDEKRLRELDDKVSRGEKLSSKEAQEYNQLDAIQQSGKQQTPSAPFVTDTNSWVKLGVKVALKEAVAQGVDRIAWTTGEQQNERYDLSKQVNEIKVEAVEEVDGVYFVDIELSSGKTENIEVENGVIREGSYKGQSLEDVIGKEYAEKVLSTPRGETKRLRGADLRLGGKGMKGFYGSPKEGSKGILGSVMEAVTGQEVGRTILRDDLKKAEGPFPFKEDLAKIFIENAGTILVGDEKVLIERYSDLVDYIKNNGAPQSMYFGGPATSTQPSISITPELKASVNKGQPLFGTRSAARDNRIKELKNEISGDLNTQGVAWDPENEAESARKMGEKLTELARLMIEATGISAKEFIDQQIANAMALKGEIYDGLKMTIKDIATKAYEAAKFLPKKMSEKAKKAAKGKSRKKAYERRLMKEYKNSDSLKKAIQANGLDYKVVGWKTVLPMSNEIVSSIFAEKNYVEGIKQLAEDIEGTTVADYRGNEHLSTLHALIAHQVIDELARRGDIKNFRKWTDYFSSDARSQGRFVSAMQEDASPFAARNRTMRSATKQADVAMERAATDGRKVQEHVDEIQEKLKLTEKEVERLTKVIEDLVKQKLPKPQAPPAESIPQGPTSPRGFTSGKSKIQSGLSKLQLGARKARGQASAGVPLNKEIIEGVRELAEGFIQEGIYQADMLVAAVMKEVKKALRGDKELIKEIEKNIESILDIESVEEMMEEDGNEKFVQKLVARAKANILDKAPKQKTAEDVLIDVLLNKINEGLPKTKRERVDNTYRKLAEAIANRDFSDEIWQQAMRDVESWLDRARITPEQKAEVLGRLEEMASGFMEQPFSNSDLRKAIRLGIKDAGVEVAKVVREHMTKQNATMASLEERLIRELGLDPKSAAEYADVFRAELEKLFEETRAKEINRILNLDTAGMPKKKAERVNRRASDGIMQAMNLGILSDANFRQVFSEKYNFPNIDREKLAMIGMLNDLIHRHQGTEMSRFYEKQLMDYIESLKPWDARKMAVESYSLMIRGMLTGIVTNTVNIPIGSLMSFTAGAMPRILANPVATAAFLKEFNTTGMKGIGRQTFKSIMESGFDPMDGSTQKFEDRGNVTGSAVDYYLNSYDLREQWENVSNSKGLPGAMKGIAIASARIYLMTSKIANFAQAFDALMSYKGSELDQFIAEYNEQMRLAGGVSNNMDTAAIKRIIENTKRYMGYAPDVLEDAQDKVDAEIAAMTARGEKVPPGLRQRRIKEELSTRRDVEKMKASLDRVREFVLMEKPQGFSGQAYRSFTEATAIKEGDSATGVATKMFAKLAFGLFLRITVSSAQRITENVPGVSLALPGIFYEWQNLPVDPTEPNGKKEWRMALTPKDKMKARLMTHAAVSALAMGAAMVMFSIGDEEEDKYGRKSRKLKLNPDRWLDITGIGTGKWYQNEVLREGDRERKDFMLSIKVNGRWHDIIPARLMPHLLPMIGILGGMRDMATLNPDGFKDATMEEQLANGFDDMAFGMTSFTYASIPKTAQKLMLASNKETSIESGMSLAEEMGSIVLNPMRTAIYPNVLRDVRNEYKALSGDPALMGKGLMWAVTKEVPIAEDMVGNERHDPFGYEKVRTSKVLNAAKEVPGLSIIIDHPMYHAIANEDRFSEPVWKLKSEYHPNLLVNNHYPKGQTAEDADLMNKVYGEKMRGLWLDNEKYVKAYDHAQMAKLQEFFNEEAVNLMKMEVAAERVQKLSMAFEEGKNNKMFTSKLDKIEEETEKWRKVLSSGMDTELLEKKPEQLKKKVEMEMSEKATYKRKREFLIKHDLPILD